LLRGSLRHAQDTLRDNAISPGQATKPDSTRWRRFARNDSLGNPLIGDTAGHHKDDNHDGAFALKYVYHADDSALERHQNAF
jgi:hypothetical protein